MNFIEYYRTQAIKQIFGLDSFKRVFITSWQKQIKNKIFIEDKITGCSLQNLADSLRDIFFTTSPDSKRSQGDLSTSGTIFECLIVYYLNIGLVGTRSVAFRPSKFLTPRSISEAYSITHNVLTRSDNSGSEPDIIILTFPEPNKMKYNKKFLERFNGKLFNTVELDNITNTNELPLIEEINRIIEDNFDNVALHIIQSKTNWNDNAQIPMAWDIIYSSHGFRDKNIQIGTSRYSLNKLLKYTYSFVTVPTQKNTDEKFKESSISVLRVKSLTGGNYWCLPSKNNVAKSIFMLFNLILDDEYIKNINTRTNDNLEYIKNLFDIQN